MCWNYEFSLFSALFGWATCIILFIRNKSDRDRFYARYLFTFTFTQLADIFLWVQNDSHELKSCVEFQEQFGKSPVGNQYQNFLMTKFCIPLIVFSQHAMQCTYPSLVLQNKRIKLILLHLIPVAGMSYAFACTDVIQGNFPRGSQTLRWGGDFTSYPSFLLEIAAILHSGIVAYVFWLLMPKKVAIAHLTTLLAVVLTLAFTERTIILGSKWCTYCLIYSVVYLTDPWWNKSSDKQNTEKIQTEDQKTKENIQNLNQNNNGKLKSQ